MSAARRLLLTHATHVCANELAPRLISHGIGPHGPRHQFMSHQFLGSGSTDDDEAAAIYAITPKCCVCKAMEVPLRSCARCHTALYCGRECQKFDWKGGHKQVCAASLPAVKSTPADEAALEARRLLQQTSMLKFKNQQEFTRASRRGVHPDRVMSISAVETLSGEIALVGAHSGVMPPGVPANFVLKQAAHLEFTGKGKVGRGECAPARGNLKGERACVIGSALFKPRRTDVCLQTSPSFPRGPPNNSPSALPPPCLLSYMSSQISALLRRPRFKPRGVDGFLSPPP